MINLTATEKENFSIIEIEIEGGVATPNDLKEIVYPTISYEKGVIVSGRAPIWLVCTVVHQYHPTAWVATFDPRLGGGVVCMTHSKDRSVGDIVPMDLGL